MTLYEAYDQLQVEYLEGKVNREEISNAHRQYSDVWRVINGISGRKKKPLHVQVAEIVLKIEQNTNTNTSRTH